MCETVRDLSVQRRFKQDLDSQQLRLTHRQFMLYSYKTSFCPKINQNHMWGECKYAHRQQDFRRSPSSFFYWPELCPDVTEDGQWDECDDYLECEYAHSLIEIFFNPLYFKLYDCDQQHEG